MDKEEIKKALRKAYNEGWVDYEVYQNPQRGTPKHFLPCWIDSKSKELCDTLCND